MDNKFIIISPSYNNQEWTDVYYDSIECQTYKNYHVFYIDDCSTDNTQESITSLINGNPRFTYVRNEINKGATFNYVNSFETRATDENDIFVNLDGDDWLATPDVLEKLNEEYNKHDCWMTYGKMMVYDGTGYISEATQQNSPYLQFTHDHQFYRRDIWRASHLRTFKKFLIDKVDKKDFVSKIDNKLFWHASDLAFMYPLLEMSPPEKIGVISFPTYVYNNSKSNAARTKERDNTDNHKFEYEIINKKVYVRKSNKHELDGERLPQVNIIGDYKERNSIPKNHSIVYNREFGDFDITMVQDGEILKIISGDKKVDHGKIIADIHEPPYLFNQSDVYQGVLTNYDKFDRILTFHENLLKLPNAMFRNGGGEVVLNKNIHKIEYPELQNNSLIKIYEKSKSVSFITSNKQFSLGHVFRIKCASKVLSEKLPVDVFGVGIKEIRGKIDALRDYRFSVAMENGQYKNYFTEKILDCFLTGTIPIYWGCPNVGDYFNVDGFFIFNTDQEFVNIIRSLNENEYNKRKSIIKENFDKANDWRWDNDIYFEKYIKDLIH